ncbi:MAG: putative sulfate exporter family transporter [Burkholderiales bacterium]|nr:putative sulfate exporter family transporter [Burkholderiales bacterium]MBK8665493.1 putative sulfate exporter family transporter [Burkholderiales bacterium]
MVRTSSIVTWPARVVSIWPGAAVCLLAALAASFVSDHHGGPALLYALLMGLALNFVSDHPAVGPGVTFCARTALRCGVALLGARITLGQVADIGAGAAVVIALALAATIGFGAMLARVLKQPRDHGLLSGASVGICGASAALAVAAVLPATRENERFTLLTVVGVTILSTVAMVLYPLGLKLLELSPATAGIFIGGTIHDVAQVVAAGTLLGPAATDAAVITKLYRVALLAPVVLILAIVLRSGRQNAVGSQVPLLPGFMVAFIALVLIGSLGWLNPTVSDAASSLSRWLLIIAIAAVGVKTKLQDIAKLGWRPLVMLIAETAFIAAVVGGAAMLHVIGR